MNKDLATAKFYLLLAIQLHSFSAVQYNIASIYEDMGEIQLAKQHYQQAATRNNRAGYASKNNLARLETLRGNYTLSIEIIIQVIEQVKDNDIMAALSKNIRIAAAWFGQDDFDKAKKYLEELRESNKSNKFIYDLLSDLLKLINTNKYEQKSASNTINIDEHREKPRRIHITQGQAA